MAATTGEGRAVGADRADAVGVGVFDGAPDVGVTTVTGVPGSDPAVTVGLTVGRPAVGSPDVPHAPTSSANSTGTRRRHRIDMRTKTSRSDGWGRG